MANTRLALLLVARQVKRGVGDDSLDGNGDAAEVAPLASASPLCAGCCRLRLRRGSLLAAQRGQRGALLRLRSAVAFGRGAYCGGDAAARAAQRGVQRLAARHVRIKHRNLACRLWP